MYLNSAFNLSGVTRRKISEAQPPPRTSTFRPLILKIRWFCLSNSEVICRIPKCTSWRSDILPAVSNCMPNVYRFGLPICTDHQRRGFEKRSCGYSAGEKLTDLVSCG